MAPALSGPECRWHQKWVTLVLLLTGVNRVFIRSGHHERPDSNLEVESFSRVQMLSENHEVTQEDEDFSDLNKSHSIEAQYLCHHNKVFIHSH